MTEATRQQAVLHYLGHSSFLWVTPSGYRILIDPYRNGPDLNWFVRPFPRIECDIVVVTHPHFDHDGIGGLRGQPTVVRGAIDLRGADFRVRTIMGKHAGEYGHEFGQRNLICVTEVASTTYCHVGDNEADLTDEL